MSDLIQLGLGLLGGMGPFGKALGAVVVIITIIILIRRNRSEEDERREKVRAKTLDDVQSDYDAERARRIDADRTVSRYLNGIRYWNGRAHEQLNARLGDRQMHMAHERRSGIEALILPEIAPLPPISEENE